MYVDGPDNVRIQSCVSSHILTLGVQTGACECGWGGVWKKVKTALQVVLKVTEFSTRHGRQM